MSDPTLRWVVTLLFGASTAAYAYILVAQHRRWTNTVDHVLHLAMSAAMILMAWDVGMELPTVGTMIFFLLAGLWFARAAVRMSTANGERLTNGYYAVMMAAMAWMFAVMNGSPPGETGHASDHGPSAERAMSMPEKQMTSAHEMFPTGSGAGWITAVNWIATVGFLVVALYRVCQYLARRRTNPGSGTLLEALHEVCTAAGMALMFGTLL